MFFSRLLLLRYLRNLALLKAILIVYESSISGWNLFFINIRLTFAQILFFIMRSLAWRTSLQSNNRWIKASLFLFLVSWDYLRLLDFFFLLLFQLLAFFCLLLLEFFSKIWFSLPKLSLFFLFLLSCLFLLFLSLSHKLLLLFGFLFHFWNNWHFNLWLFLIVIREGMQYGRYNWRNLINLR